MVIVRVLVFTVIVANLSVFAIPIQKTDAANSVRGGSASCHVTSDGKRYPPVVPLPAFWDAGPVGDALTLSSKFSFEMDKADSDIKFAFTRYTDLTFPHKTHEGVQDKHEKTLHALRLVVKDQHAALGLDMDEAYELAIPSPLNRESDGRLVATLTAATQVGAYRGLETFSQLVSFDFDEKLYSIGCVPWTIMDFPRFSHRELLVDTGRHFLSPTTLKTIISALPSVKINVLHWHLIDTQAFPLESKRNPLLSKLGAFSPAERYSSEDVAEVVEWARQHGVRVVPEIDVPGHAASWCKGYPEICPSPNCTQPLSPVTPTPLTPSASNATWMILEGLFSDVAEMFPDAMIHLGGDEVNTACWSEAPAISTWLQQNNVSAAEALTGFLQRAHELAASHNRQVTCWDEVWTTMGKALPQEAIVQLWRGEKKADFVRNVTTAGNRVIWSQDPIWYLDQLAVTWDKAWAVDICQDVPDELCKKVIGGGGEQWGETVDASDALQTIFPRLAAIAEALWSSNKRMSFPGGDKEGSAVRMAELRCLLNRRGIAAAPLNNSHARAAPPGPGACLLQ